MKKIANCECGGEIMVATNYLSLVPPVPTCTKCGESYEVPKKPTWGSKMAGFVACSVLAVFTAGYPQTLRAGSNRATVGSVSSDDVSDNVWEDISGWPPYSRMRTPHGWLVANSKEAVYIPDPNHEWLSE